MVRSIVYDATHLRHRLACDTPSGIDRVDLAFGRHFTSHPQNSLSLGTHYRYGHPHYLSPLDVTAIVKQVDKRWRESIRIEEDDAYVATCAWLNGEPIKQCVASSRVLVKEKLLTKIVPFFRYSQPRVFQARSLSIDDGAIYINIAQHAFENPVFFKWLSSRRDLQRVFFIHDLLPLDHPEFWGDGYLSRFERRVSVMLEHATAILTSSHSVRNRLKMELVKRGLPALPIFTRALASPLGRNPLLVKNKTYGDQPFFIVIGTIEPRKNHLLLLNIWRDMVAGGGSIPKLIIIGKRGWENEQVVDLLERCPSLSPYVFEISGLSNAGLRNLISKAQALLIPSFAEGYGLPLVEALTLGTPVVASDIPVFHETAQEKAIFRSAIDGIGWRSAILALSDPESVLAQDARAAAQEFIAPIEEDYFAALDDFLASL